MIIISWLKMLISEINPLSLIVDRKKHLIISKYTMLFCLLKISLLCQMMNRINFS